MSEATAWDTPVVDCHVHVFKQDMPLVGSPRHKPAYSFTGEQLVETLDQHGVALAVIAAASPWGDYNDYIIEVLRRYPRLRGTVILDPSVERMVLAQMKRDGVVGVRLPFISMAQVSDVTTPEYRRFLYRLADLDWHVHPHIEGDKLPQLLPGLEAAGVKIVIDHIGRPDPKTGVNGEGFRRMLASIEKGRTWVKLSAAYRLGPAAADWRASSSGRRDPSGWSGRATVRSSARRRTSPIGRRSTGSTPAFPTRRRGARSFATRR